MGHTEITHIKLFSLSFFFFLIFHWTRFSAIRFTRFIRQFKMALRFFCSFSFYFTLTIIYVEKSLLTLSDRFCVSFFCVSLTYKSSSRFRSHIFSFYLYSIQNRLNAYKCIEMYGFACVCVDVNVSVYQVRVYFSFS